MTLLFNRCSKEGDAFFQEKTPNYKFGACNYECPNGWQVVSGIMCPGGGYEVCVVPFECRPQITNACSNIRN